jgi:hypothetical protein
MSSTSIVWPAYTSRRPFTDWVLTMIGQASRDVFHDVGKKTYPSIPTKIRSEKIETYLPHLRLNDQAIGFYEQASTVNCRHVGRDIKTMLRAFGTDFILLHEPGPFVVDVKSEREARIDVKEKPHDWMKSNDRIVDVAAEIAIAKMSLARFFPVLKGREGLAWRSIHRRHRMLQFAPIERYA